MGSCAHGGSTSIYKLDWCVSLDISAHRMIHTDVRVLETLRIDTYAARCAGKTSVSHLKCTEVT